jgi:hypothetical protein
MSFDSLPTELLALIVTHLSPCGIADLAKIFNRRLYTLCLPSIRRQTSFLGHARDMVDKFDEIDAVELAGPEIDCDVYACSGLAGTYGAHDHHGFAPKPRGLDFLDLNGDMYWLQPRLDYAWDLPLELQDHEIVIDGLGKLLRQTDALGLTVPECFIRFMRSPELQRLIMQSSWDFTLGPLRKFHICKGSCRRRDTRSLQKLKKKCFDAKEGYIVAFL